MWKEFASVSPIKLDNYYVLFSYNHEGKRCYVASRAIAILCGVEREEDTEMDIALEFPETRIMYNNAQASSDSSSGFVDMTPNKLQVFDKDSDGELFFMGLFHKDDLEEYKSQIEFDEKTGLKRVFNT